MNVPDLLEIERSVCGTLLAVHERAAKRLRWRDLARAVCRWLPVQNYYKRRLFLRLTGRRAVA